MRCDEFIRKISEYLDDRLPLMEKKEFELHRDRCPSCAKALEQSIKTVNLCHSLRELPLPEGFSDQLKKRLHAEPAKSGTKVPQWLRDRRLYVGAAALAASFVLVMGPFYTMYSGSKDNPETVTPTVTQTPPVKGRIQEDVQVQIGEDSMSFAATENMPSAAAAQPTAAAPAVTPQAAAAQTEPSVPQEAPQPDVLPAAAPQGAEQQIGQQRPQIPQTAEASETSAASETVPEAAPPLAPADCVQDRSADEHSNNAETAPEQYGEDGHMYAALSDAGTQSRASDRKSSSSASGGGSGGSSGGGGSAPTAGAPAVAAQKIPVEYVAVKPADSVVRQLAQQAAVKVKETSAYQVYRVGSAQADAILSQAEETSCPDNCLSGIDVETGFTYIVITKQ